MALVALGIVQVLIYFGLNGEVWSIPGEQPAPALRFAFGVASRLHRRCIALLLFCGGAKFRTYSITA